ncbi:MAG: gamma-glutamylcyclotransferase [Gammaproteobacteria bacterium]|jgi:cation transport regulator ChaC|nr:gamma-glutamylcyclotransferase [Gammaproteobacteria bacterium]
MTWIFGYGSLIWRPAFAYEAQRKAALRGWRRRFWQASPDHRGVPEAPGRVVTLVPDAQAVCWGMAFRVAHAQWQDIIAELDHRERNGYTRCTVALEFEDGGATDAITYVALADNPSFIGPAPLAAMLRQIGEAHGPSGSNREYVTRLAEHLTHLNIHDEEVHGLHSALLAADVAHEAMRS